MCVQYLSTNDQVPQVIMYRAETMFAVLSSLRIFLLWPILKNEILASLPRRHTISAFSNVEMGSAFAFKIVLNNESRALRFIAVIWAFTFLLCAFWFRAAEFTACLLPSAKSAVCNTRQAKFWSLGAPEDADAEFEKVNDGYIWNALWGMFITSTSVGYGDVLATTHLGRTVCLISAISGLICAATLTASLSVVLQWTDEETSAMLLVRREQAKREMRVHAKQLIHNWLRAWVRRQKGGGNDEDARHSNLMRDTFRKRQAFRKAKLATLVTLEDCQADTKKVCMCV